MLCGSNGTENLGMSATRDFPGISKILGELKPGDQIRISRSVRINSSHSWAQTIEGAFVQANHLRTGLATDRVAADDIVLACVHIKKPNNEMASITIDDSTTIQKL
jgi:hypothetical protein